MCKDASQNVNFILISSHGRDMAHRFVEIAWKVNLCKLFSGIWRFYDNFMNPDFHLWPDDVY